jgi:hypothetical protein
MRIGTALNLITGSLLGGTVGFLLGQGAGGAGYEVVLGAFVCAGGCMLIGGGLALWISA